jgi:hypothetical protein
MAEFSFISKPSPVPDLLTIEETGRVLRIGRTATYSLIPNWRETGGKEGIPYVAFGSSYRVPTAALEAMLGRPITHIPDPKRRSSITSAAQSSGPFDAGTAEVRQLHSRHSKPGQNSDNGRGQGAFPYRTQFSRTHGKLSAGPGR